MNNECEVRSDSKCVNEAAQVVVLVVVSVRNVRMIGLPHPDQIDCNAARLAIQVRHDVAPQVTWELALCVARVFAHHHASFLNLVRDR